MGSFTNFIATNAAPEGAAKIGVYNESGTRIGSIPLNTLNKKQETRGSYLYRVGLISDIHMDSQDYSSLDDETRNYWVGDEAQTDFQRVIQYFTGDCKVDLICSAGDLGLQTLDEEFGHWQTLIGQYAPNTPAYTCTGNHDVYTAGGGNFKNYTRRALDTNSYELVEDPNYPLSFYFEKDTEAGSTVKDLFIFFSMYQNTPTGEAYRDSDLTWLESVLEANKDKRSFLFTHYFFPAYAGNLGRVKGATQGGMYGTSKALGGNSAKEAAFMQLLAKYPNVMWFSGHCHWKYNLQKYQANANIDRFKSGDTVNGVTYGGSFENGAWTVHLSSLSSPIDCENYITTECSSSTNQVGKPAGSEAAYMDVYEKGVEFVGIDMNTADTTTGISTTANMKFLPMADYWMDFTVQEGGGTITGYSVDDVIDYTTIAAMSEGDTKYVAINSVSYNACQLGASGTSWANVMHDADEWTNHGTGITDAQAEANEATLLSETQSNVTNSASCVFILTKTSNGFTLKNLDGNYLQASTTGTGSGTWDTTEAEFNIINSTNTTSSGAIVKQSNNSKLVAFTFTSDESTRLYFATETDVYWNVNSGGWTIWYIYNVTPLTD